MPEIATGARAWRAAADNDSPCHYAAGARLRTRRRSTLQADSSLFKFQAAVGV